MRATELYGGIFSRHAAAYRARHRQIRSEGRERALELLAVQPGERVLDLACGPGNLSRRLAAARGWVVGVDIAEGMLALARSDVPEAAFARTDLARLGLAGAAFDAGLCGHGLQFLADLAGAAVITLLIQVLQILASQPGMPKTAPAILNYAIYGVVLVVVMLFLPEGLLPAVARLTSLHRR